MGIISRSKILECSGKKVAIDLETTGLKFWDNKIIGMGIYCPDAEVWGYMPVENYKEIEDLKNLTRQLSPETTVIMHNAKFDCHFLRIQPRELGWTLWDTTVMVHLVDSRVRKALTNAEHIYLGSDSKRGYQEEPPRGKKNKVWEWDLDLTVKYCCNDALVTYDLAEKLYPVLEENLLLPVFVKDMFYLCDLIDVEETGFLVNIPYTHRAHDALRETESKLAEALYDSCGARFNWRSHKQLSNAIYEGLGIARPVNPFADADGVDRSKFADKGKYNSASTSTFLLMEKVKHPLGELIASLRETAKLAKTLERWATLSDENNVVHSSFNLTGTRTGRLSSSKPNLQNVPSSVRGRFTQSVYTGSMERTEEYNLRKAFISRPGKSLLAIDYKQMEMRMFGILSEDPFMLSSLYAGRDIHGDIAEAVWGTRDKVHREWSKTISFGLIYGMTLGTLMYRLNKSKYEAKKITEKYYQTFPRIQPWLLERIAQCEDYLYLRYWSGRIWREEDRDYMYRGANAQIQGGCADILSVAEIRSAKWCRKQGTDHNLLNLVHDELIFEIPDEHLVRSANKLSELMQVPDIFNIPFVTDTKIGKSYGELYPLDSEVIASEQEFSQSELEAFLLASEIASEERRVSQEKVQAQVQAQENN